MYADSQMQIEHERARLDEFRDAVKRGDRKAALLHATVLREHHGVTRQRLYSGVTWLSHDDLDDLLEP